MYAEKNGLRASAGGQSAAVLLRVLTERHPDLNDHVSGVIALSEMVGRELGMTDEDRTALWQAAALHDIGKAAVPDAILNKPGPLDDDEWAFMRRHTIIGERILDGAPALTAAARLVRSSHEHFDGHGYPDELAGADIPLGSRIVAVCDAYDAMISDRPYRRGMTREQAITELRTAPERSSIPPSWTHSSPHTRARHSTHLLTHFRSKSPLRHNPPFASRGATPRLASTTEAVSEAAAASPDEVRVRIAAVTYDVRTNATWQSHGGRG